MADEKEVKINENNKEQEKDNKPVKINEAALRAFEERIKNQNLENLDFNSKQSAEDFEQQEDIAKLSNDKGTIFVKKTKTAAIEKSVKNTKNEPSSGSTDGEDGERVIVKTLDEVMHDSMLPYTEYVIMDRALPRVEDGLKPVQRRILYTMLELGLEADKPFRKSARIVGDCLGKYHPHGDKSVYDAMVRMAQDFNMRGILVSGHGNFGSVDGDSAAAMRYTEARLAPLAMELLRDLNCNTVKFNLNFDDSLKEPEVLPGRFPNLLVNGASGIAVSLATNIPPHNLGEVIDGTVAYIENKNITLKQMLKIIKGPDFPTGAFLIAGEELEKAYETGRGKVLLRAKISIETTGERKNIVITQLPYQVNKASLLQSIAELSEEKKQTALGGISDIVDESDRSGMRAVIKLKKDASLQQILALLFKHTQLETTFGINIVAIADNRPQQMGLLDIIAYYVEYQRDIIYKRSKHLLEEAKEREHIVEGLVIATKNIDEVVKIIKKSASPAVARDNLRSAFRLSERQAQAILDMRLARLTNLEVVKLQKELEDLRSKIKELNAILGSKKVQYEVVKNELLAIKRAHKDERRTIILKDEGKYEAPADDDPVATQDCYIAASMAGSLKRISAKNYNMSQKEFSDTENVFDVHDILIKTTTDTTILVFTNFGNCFKMQAADIFEAKWKERGVALKGLANGENIIYILPFDENLSKKVLAFFTREGMVKFSSIEEYVVAKNCFAATKLKEGDEVINMGIMSGADEMLFVTKNKMVVYADKSDVPLQGRISTGVKGAGLYEGDKCVFATFAPANAHLCAVSENGYIKRVALSEFKLIGRGGKGLKMGIGEEGDTIAFACLAANGGIVMQAGDDENIFKSFNAFKTEGRTAKGKPAIKLKKNNKIIKCCLYNI